MYEIIEDCSPYYIKFRYPGLEAFIDAAKKKYHTCSLNDPAHFYMRTLDFDPGMELLNMLPYRDQFSLNTNRVSYIISMPGARNHIHIDGGSVSFNYGINILDQNCITRWYDFDTVESNYISKPNLPMDRYSVSPDQVKNKPIPCLKSFTHNDGEAVLFNSDIYHDVDNSTSPHRRAILTFRTVPPGKIKFEDAKRILFNQ